METNGDVIKKTVAILNALAKKNGTSGVTELSAALCMPKATVHRILNSLCESNVAIRTDGGRYRVGPTTLLWSGGYRASSAIVDLASPLLSKLRDESGETVHLSVYNGGTLQYAERFDSTQNVILRWSRLGVALPLYCTAAGRAVLSRMPQKELDEYFASVILTPRTDKTVVSKRKLIQMLDGYRARGYAEEVEENEENIRCVGSAIADGAGAPKAAISLTAPTFRFTDEDAAKYGPRIAAVAKEISKSL